MFALWHEEDSKFHVSVRWFHSVPDKVLQPRQTEYYSSDKILQVGIGQLTKRVRSLLLHGWTVKVDYSVPSEGTFDRKKNI